MTDENKVAEPSAAAVVERVQFDGWDEKGNPVITKDLEPKAQESEPAAPPAKEAESENIAEPETASTQGKKERKPGDKVTAEERKAQLAAEIKALNDEVKALKAERERSRETAPKPSVETKPEPKAEAPKRPNPFNWKGTAEEYDEAMESYEKHMKQQAVVEFQRTQAEQAQAQSMQRQLEEIKAKYPDAEDRIKDTFESFAKVEFPGVIRSMLNDSECLPEVMYVLADEATRKNFIETAKTNPGKAIRALAQIEADVRAKQSVTAPKAETKSEPKAPEEPKPRAPKPPSEVGGRATAAEDARRSAAESGDFRSFEAEENRRKFARPAA